MKRLLVPILLLLLPTLACGAPRKNRAALPPAIEAVKADIGLFQVVRRTGPQVFLSYVDFALIPTPHLPVGGFVRVFGDLTTGNFLCLRADGTSCLPSGGGGGGGITSFNLLTAAAQTLATGTTGLDFNISSSGSIHTFNIPNATSTHRGFISSADWNAFNIKENVLTFSSPLLRVANVINCPTCVVTSRNINTTGLIAGGGDLSLDRTLSIVAFGTVPGTGVVTSALGGDPVANNCVKWVAGGKLGDNGSSCGGAGGITVLNTLAVATQTFATGTSGVDFNISSAVSTHTFNIPSASSVNRGLLTSADWSTFNNKQPTVTVTSPITKTGNSVGIVNQGATTLLLHGNGAGNASFGSVVLADIGAGILTGNGTKLATSTGGLVSGNCVKLDATGNFVDNGATCGGGGGTPAGSNTQPQFNDSGAFGGMANVAYVKATGVTTWTQKANGNDLNISKRFTDVAPTGTLWRLQNAAGTDLFKIDIAGAVTAPSYSANSSGAGSIQLFDAGGVNSVTITPGTLTGARTQKPQDVSGDISVTIAKGTAVMTTALIGAGACGATVTVAATGTLTTDRIEFANNASVAANPGVLIINRWPTVDNVNFNYCNGTSAGVTPSAATLNWGVVR